MDVVSLPDDNQWQAMQQDVEVLRLSRDEFLHEVFAPEYEAGQHVTLLGPTQSGKTTVAYKMLDLVATPQLPAVVLVMKPRDQVVTDWTKLTGFRKTQRWPPVWNRAWTKKGGGLGKKQRGWVFWPKHSLKDIDRDDKMLSREFRLALTESYSKGDRIVFADEIVGLSKDLGLEKELNAIWTRGAAMGCGLWAASQRPFHAPVAMYSSSEHLILFNDPDKRDRDRFGEIGGVDPHLVEEIVVNLRKYEFLYIGRSMAEDRQSPALAIVNA